MRQRGWAPPLSGWHWSSTAPDDVSSSDDDVTSSSLSSSLELAAQNLDACEQRRRRRRAGSLVGPWPHGDWRRRLVPAIAALARPQQA